MEASQGGPGHHHRSLTDGLRAVASDEAGGGASPEVETRLMAEVRSIGRTRRRRRYVALSGIAAGLLLVAAVSGWRMTVRPRAIVVDSMGDPSAGEVATAFLPLGYSRIPMTSGQIVRLEVPRAALASFGLAAIDVPAASRSATVLADVLVGEDGLARAVRFVRPMAPPQP